MPRGAARSTPVCMRRDLEDRVDAVAEAAREAPAALQRPAGQEALSGLAVGIVEIDRAVVGAEAEELARRGAELQADIEQVLVAARRPARSARISIESPALIVLVRSTS